MSDSVEEIRTPLVDSPQAAESLRSLASAMVGLMPPERRAVFALAVEHRLSYREIAARLDMAEDAIKFHIRDGLATMYREVRAQAGGAAAPEAQPHPAW